MNMLEADNKHSGLNGDNGGGRQVSNARMDMVEVDDECSDLNGHGEGG